MSEPLRSEQLEALLRRLGPDRESAGTRYEQLRRQLVVVFEKQRCRHPEELADETLDRAACKLLRIGSEFVGSDPGRFVFGVAWNVARESFRRYSPLALADQWETSARAALRTRRDEQETACLECCLKQLAPADRCLALDYYQGERSTRIRRRADLARELGLSPNALRLKIHRLTTQLRECVVQSTADNPRWSAQLHGEERV